jgi:ABC-type dipeptide/oligopeptide/nickel transport system permease component
MRLHEYVIRRLLFMTLVLFGISLITFYLSRGFPSAFAPWAPYITPKMTAEQIARVIHEHGFDRPLYEQYFYWLRDIASGNWGLAGQWANGLPVHEVFAARFPYTVELAIFGVIFTIAISLPLGILSAVKNNSIPDHLARLIALTGISTPAYWFGFMLQLVFFYYFFTWGLPYLPSQGALSSELEGAVPRVTGVPLVDGLLAGNLTYAYDALQHVILPALTLSFTSIGYLTRLIRASMLEVLRQDYIVMARSKGLRERVVIYRHALRNALIPALTIGGLLFAGLLGGAPITEFVFNWPGVGGVSISAVLQGDSNFIMLYTLVTALIVVLANLIVDILYALVDPRIKY